MADLATLETRLTEAEAAYHRLMTGVSEVTVQINDQRITYKESSAVDLAIYIADLRAQISALAGGSVSGSPRRALEVDL